MFPRFERAYSSNVAMTYSHKPTGKDPGQYIYEVIIRGNLTVYNYHI
jgi:hypothetical protein